MSSDISIGKFLVGLAYHPLVKGQNRKSRPFKQIIHKSIMNWSRNYNLNTETTRPIHRGDLISGN